MIPSKGILSNKSTEVTTNIIVGNGAKLSISHVRRVVLNTSAGLLVLNVILHVPSIEI